MLRCHLFGHKPETTQTFLLRDPDTKATLTRNATAVLLRRTEYKCLRCGLKLASPDVDFLHEFTTLDRILLTGAQLEEMSFLGQTELDPSSPLIPDNLK